MVQDYERNNSIEFTKVIESQDFSNKNFNNLLSKIPEMIVEYSRTGYLNEVLSVLDRYKLSLYKTASELSIENDSKLNTAYILGYLKSSINIISTFRKTRLKDETDSETLTALTRSPQIMHVLTVLYDHTMISHSDLASKLQMHKTALSMTIKRADRYDFIESKKYGKFKYYYLTASGKSIFEKHLKGMSLQKPTSDELTLKLLDVITKSVLTGDYDTEKWMSILKTEYSDAGVLKLDLFRHKARRLSLALEFENLRAMSKSNLKTDIKSFVSYEIGNESDQQPLKYEFGKIKDEKMALVSFRNV